MIAVDRIPPYPTFSEFVHGLRNQQPIAFERFVERYQRLIMSVTMKILRPDLQLAEEATSDTMLQAWRKIHTTDERVNTEGGLIAWTTAIGKHKAIDLYRKVKRRAPLNLPLFNLDVEEGEELDLYDIESRTLVPQAVQKALAALPESQREAITLHYFNGFTHSEIAQRTNKPLGTVKTQVKGGQKKLRASLAPFHQQLTAI